jgi:hypothetical protein
MGEDLFAGRGIALRVRRKGDGSVPVDASIIEQIATRILVTMRMCDS